MDAISYIANTFFYVVAVGLVQPVFTLPQYETGRADSLKQDVEALLPNSQDLHYIEDEGKAKIQSIENNSPTFEEMNKSVEDTGQEIYGDSKDSTTSFLQLLTDLSDAKYNWGIMLMLQDIFLQKFFKIFWIDIDVWFENLSSEDKERVLVYVEHLAGIENAAAGGLNSSLAEFLETKQGKLLSKIYRYRHPMYPPFDILTHFMSKMQKQARKPYLNFI